MRSRPLSSTHSRSENGQALAVFAISITAVLLAAALAFDAGIMFVERRDEQNAADAAAIAGARYLTGLSGSAKSDAEAAARGIATDNGFTNGDGDVLVDVNIPPIHGSHRGLQGYIEVEIANRRPSVFASVMGILNWDVSARAVARNSEGSANDFTILALDESRPNAFKVTGTGEVFAYGDLQVNSTDPQALMANGGGTIDRVTRTRTRFRAAEVDAMGGACNVVGGIKDPQDAVTCIPNTGARSMDDPLVDLRAPALPLKPLPVEAFDEAAKSAKKGVPSGCPTATGGATWEAPKSVFLQERCLRWDDVAPPSRSVSGWN